MAKNIVIRKHQDKIEVRDADGNLIVDVIVAKSSRTCSVNLSVQADRKFAIDKVPQGSRNQLWTNAKDHEIRAKAAE